MFAKKNDCFELINESLNGSRPFDEETFASVAVLAERLEKVKRKNSCFDHV